jgi:hypothetical protein
VSAGCNGCGNYLNDRRLNGVHIGALMMNVTAEVDRDGEAVVYLELEDA